MTEDISTTTATIQDYFASSSKYFLKAALSARLKGKLSKSVNLLKVLQQHSTILKQSAAQLAAIENPIRYCEDTTGCDRGSTKRATAQLETLFTGLYSGLTRVAAVKSKSSKYLSRLKRYLEEIPKTYHTCE